MARVFTLAEGIQVFDLEDDRREVDEETVESIVRSLDEMRRAYEKERHAPPCLVVLTDPDLSYGTKQRFVDAGAYVCAKPEGFGQAMDRDDRKAALGLLFQLDSGARLITDRVIPHGQPPDLSIYEDPPYQISDDDYRRWIERMRTPLAKLDD